MFINNYFNLSGGESLKREIFSNKLNYGYGSSTVVVDSGVKISYNFGNIIHSGIDTEPITDMDLSLDIFPGLYSSVEEHLFSVKKEAFFLKSLYSTKEYLGNFHKVRTKDFMQEFSSFSSVNRWYSSSFYNNRKNIGKYKSYLYNFEESKFRYIYKVSKLLSSVLVKENSSFNTIKFNGRRPKPLKRFRPFCNSQVFDRFRLYNRHIYGFVGPLYRGPFVFMPKEEDEEEEEGAVVCDSYSGSFSLRLSSVFKKGEGSEVTLLLRDFLLLYESYCLSLVENKVCLQYPKKLVLLRNILRRNLFYLVKVYSYKDMFMFLNTIRRNNFMSSGGAYLGTIDEYKLFLRYKVLEARRLEKKFESSFKDSLKGYKSSFYKKEALKYGVKFKGGKLIV